MTKLYSQLQRLLYLNASDAAWKCGYNLVILDMVFYSFTFLFFSLLLFVLFKDKFSEMFFSNTCSLVMQFLNSFKMGFPFFLFFGNKALRFFQNEILFFLFFGNRVKILLEKRLLFSEVKCLRVTCVRREQPLKDKIQDIGYPSVGQLGIYSPSLSSFIFLSLFSPLFCLFFHFSSPILFHLFFTYSFS